MTITTAFAADNSPTTIPKLAPEEMNCGDTQRTDDAGLTQAEAEQITVSLRHVFAAREASLAWKSKFDAYAIAMCSVRRGGKKFIVIDGIYQFMGTMLCDDDAGFGVVYDPEARSFGDITFRVSSCPPSTQNEK